MGPFMTRALRRSAVILGLVALALAAVAWLRTGAAIPVQHGDVVQVHNFITELYAVRGERGVLLFDAGVDPSGAALDAALKKLGAARDEVSDVYLSHGHFDHVAAASLCPNATIHLGAADEGLAEHTTTPPPLAVRALMTLMPTAPFRATHLIDGVYEADGVLALPVPGHTPGSYVFWQDGVLFTGDSMQIEGGRLVPAMWVFTADPEGNRRSLQTLGASLADRRLDAICTGHGGCTPPGEARAMLAAFLAEG